MTFSAHKNFKYLLIAFAAVVLLATALSVKGANAATVCPAFTVLHNDKVGTMEIPAGQYTLVPKGITCAQASSLFTRFLSDWDGKLPGGWVTKVSGSTKGFERTGTSQSFTLKPGAVRPSGGSTIKNGKCPGTFAVLHNDRIGDLQLRKGHYQITTTGLLCWFDVQKLAYFLNYDESGKLPRPWTVEAEMMRISRSMNHYFTLKRVSTAGGGGHYPAHATRCPGTFRVLNTTTIDGVTFAAGRHVINAYSSFSCSLASREFRKFLGAGTVPANWTLNPETAVFMTGNTGFQVEPSS